MIFLDTSAIYALASSADPNHGAAKRTFSAIIESDQGLLTHNYVLIEALALLQSRLGLSSAVAFERDSHWFEIDWVDASLHSSAASRWAAGKRGISFVDQVSFIVMQRHRLEQAFAFDDDFEKEGFRLVRA